jgi:hypothetical protein
MPSTAAVLSGQSVTHPLGEAVCITTLVLGGMYGWSPNEPVHPDHEALSALMKTKYTYSTRSSLTISSDPIVTGISLGTLTHPGTTPVDKSHLLYKRTEEQMVRVVAPPPSSPVKARTPDEAQAMVVVSLMGRRQWSQVFFQAIEAVQPSVYWNFALWAPAAGYRSTTRPRPG